MQKVKHDYRNILDRETAKNTKSAFWTVAKSSRFVSISAMNRLVALGLVLGGIALLMFGYHAAHSGASYFTYLIARSPSNKSVVMMTSGAVAVAIGLTALAQKGK